MSELKDQIRAVIAEHLGKRPEEVANDSHFSDDLGADSLDAVEIIMAIETEFDVEIEDAVSSEMTTVDKVADFITRQAA